MCCISCGGHDSEFTPVLYNVFLLTAHVAILLYNKEPVVRNFSSANLLLIWEELNLQETDFLIFYDKFLYDLFLT